MDEIAEGGASTEMLAWLVIDLAQHVGAVNFRKEVAFEAVNGLKAQLLLSVTALAPVQLEKLGLRTELSVDSLDEAEKFDALSSATEQEQQMLGRMEAEPDDFMMDCPKCARLQDEMNQLELTSQAEIDALNQQIANLQTSPTTNNMSGEISGISNLERESECPSTFSSLANGQVEVLQKHHEDQIAGLTGLVHSMKKDLDSVRQDNMKIVEEALRQNIESLTSENTQLKMSLDTYIKENSEIK